MENWKFALSSIRSHKMRSFLTMLGIIIGVLPMQTCHNRPNRLKKFGWSKWLGRHLVSIVIL